MLDVPAGYPHATADDVARRVRAQIGRVSTHHHLECRSCGRTTDVDCAVGATPCLTPGDDAGYLLDEAEVVFGGRCPSCQNRPTTGSPTTGSKESP